MLLKYLFTQFADFIYFNLLRNHQGMNSTYRRQKRRRNVASVTRTGNPASAPSAATTGNREDEIPTRIPSELEPSRKKRNDGQGHGTPAPTAGSLSNLSPALDYRPTYKSELARKGYLVDSSLGSGSYSKVKKALNSWRNFEEVAIKIIDRLKAPTDYQEKFLPRELDIWSRLYHPNVVALKNVFESASRVYMVVEYANGGDALKYIQKTGAISEDKARIWMSQIASAVCYMHDQNTAHRDLKLENLLIVDGGEKIKLCDFGFVKEVAGTEELSKTFCGSKAYAAPEILKGRSYDPKKGDIWAMGVILYIFVTGKMPFDETRGTKSILEEQMALRLHWNKSVRLSARCHNLVLGMFTWEFTKRLGIYDVINHEWFALARSVSSAVAGDCPKKPT